MARAARQYRPAHYRPDAKRVDRRESARRKELQSAYQKGGKWKLLSHFVRKENRDTMVCDWCEDGITPSEVADHIIPHEGVSDPLFFDLGNLRGMCHRHHQRKTMRQDHRIRAEFDSLVRGGASYEAARDEVVRRWRKKSE